MRYLEFKSEKDWLQEALKTIHQVISPSSHDLANHLPHNRIAIALSGGSTPLPVYRALAQEPLDGSRVEFWLVDERFVPLEHEASNYRSIRDAFRRDQACLIPTVHYFDTEQQGRDTLHQYAKTLPDTFDLVILGLGNDGHTASLFHDGRVIEAVEDRVAQIYAPSAGIVPDRLTLLAPLIQKSKKLLFLVKGEDKKAILQELLHGTKTAAEIPAKQFLLHPNATVLYCAS